MGRIRRGGYVFITWKGDHPPRHVHVFRDDVLVLKWNLEANVPITGRSTRLLIDLIEELREEGRL
jgi:hypothetical protein